eukprot:CAMPEP_0205819176 /NCGR_PEP_ID=MMETSP0206-20130828/1437_1 /ASSEMBLY_ACC=CAM_ASM_000279 /TAXON_ID=36767 /ORGANISM="Euplotes focardii, Strain TN1" /LENGTH=326 /DNA_ID=CAMNT_0053112443 /DNA_START=77 /DNA_END=1057 /DNA_ORIENTATION=-
MRTKPESFIPILEDRLTKFVGKGIKLPSGVTLMSKEGPKAVKEAIKFLKKQSPVGKITLSKELNNASQDHAKDLGSNDGRGHKSKDGSTLSDRIERYCNWGGSIGENISYRAGKAQDVVLRLVVDDGVPGRGHRDNMFNDSFTLVGVGVYDHPTWDNCVVMDYAGSISSKGKSSLTKPSYGRFKPKVEDVKEKDSDNIDIKDVPKSVRKQIEAMNLGSNYKIGRKGGEYKIEIGSGCSTADNSPTDFGASLMGSYGKPSKKKKAKSDFSSLSKPSGKTGGEPSGYRGKSVETCTRTCGGKTTKTTKTTYTFPGGKSETHTKKTTSY